MTLAGWIVTLLGACSLTFVAEAVAALYRINPVLSPETLLLAAAFAVVPAVLLKVSRGLVRSVFMVVAFVLLIAYVGRLLALSFAPQHFAYSHLIPFSDETIRRSLLILLPTTAAFWAGLWLFARVFAKNWPQSVTFSGVYRHRKAIIAISVVLAVGQLLLHTFVVSNAPATRLTFLTRIIQVDLMGLLLMFLWVQYWGNLARVEKAGVVAFFCIVAIAELIQGSRGFVLIVANSWVLVVALARPDLRLSFRSVLVIVMLGLAALPLYFTATNAIRDVVRAEGGRFVTDFPRILADPFWFGFRDSFWQLSNRFQLFDEATAVFSYHTALGPQLFTFSNVGQGILSGLVPSWLWQPNWVHLGQAFGYLYQGLAVGVAHSGAWSGFGTLYMLAGQYVILAGFIFGGLLAMALTWVSRVGAWGTGVLLFILLFLYVFFLSGNIDTLLGDLAREIIVLGLLAVLLDAVARPSSAPRADVDRQAASERPGALVT
jgi:hypothetical protein